VPVVANVNLNPKENHHYIVKLSTRLSQVFLITFLFIANPFLHGARLEIFLVDMTSI
jgi:hypothetical protein